MNLFRAPYGYPALQADAYPLPDLYIGDEGAEVDEESSSSQKDSNVWMYRRTFIGMLAFFGFFFAYMLRTNLSVAIVAMTEIVSNSTNDTVVLKLSPEEKGTLLGGFFYGYILTQIFGGWLSIKVGGAKIFGAGIMISSMLALVTPLLAPFGIYIFVFIRAAQGFVQGATYPSMHAVWSRWAPPDERTRLASMGFSGAFMGTMVTYPLCSLIATRFGWPYIFYFPGGASLVWWLVWFTTVRDEPENDPWISAEELDYLKSELKDGEHKDIKHPWLSFFTSMPVWAIVVSHFCQNWGFYTMFTNLPTFLKDTLKFEFNMAGVLSALPFLVMSLGLPIAGVIIDKIRKLGIFSITTIRKIFNCGAFIVQSGFMFMATRFQEPLALVICLTFANGVGAFAWAAFGVNHLDIAPPHAGVLMGISNMMATFAGVCTTKLVGAVVHKMTLDEWNIIFLVASGFYLFGAIFYLFFGSGEKQPWVVETTTVTTSRAATTTVEDEDDFFEALDPLT